MKHFVCGRGKERAKRPGTVAGIIAGIAGILLVFLGCAGYGQGRENPRDIMAEKGYQEGDGGRQNEVSAVPAYQFAPGFGIIAHSPYPVYVLENEGGYAVTRDGVKVELLCGIMQNNELTAKLRISDYRENRPEDDMGADPRLFDMRFFGPGIPDTGYTAERMGWHRENRDTGDAGYRETLAEFCITSKKIDTEKGLDGYYFRIDGLDENLECSWTMAKGYEQISDMEGVVGHEGRWMAARAVPAGEKGLAVELYGFSENSGEQVIPGRINPLSSQKEEILLLGEDKKVYRQMGESLSMVMNRGTEGEYVINGSGGFIQYFDVPAQLQNGRFQLSVPSVTLISSEESRVVTLPLTGTGAGTEEIPDREILFGEQGLEILSIETTGEKGISGSEMDTGKKGTFESEIGASDGRGTGEFLACRLELGALAAKGGRQMEMVLCRVKTKGTTDKDEWLNVMPDQESILAPGGHFIFNLPYEEGDDSVTFQLWHPYYVWDQPFSLEVSAS